MRVDLTTLESEINKIEEKAYIERMSKLIPHIYDDIDSTISMIGKSIGMKNPSIMKKSIDQKYSYIIDDMKNNKVHDLEKYIENIYILYNMPALLLYSYVWYHTPVHVQNKIQATIDGMYKFMNTRYDHLHSRIKKNDEELDGSPNNFILLSTLYKHYNKSSRTTNHIDMSSQINEFNNNIIEKDKLIADLQEKMSELKNESDQIIFEKNISINRLSSDIDRYQKEKAERENQIYRYQKEKEERDNEIIRLKDSITGCHQTVEKLTCEQNKLGSFMEKYELYIKGNIQKRHNKEHVSYQNSNNSQFDKTIKNLENITNVQSNEIQSLKEEIKLLKEENVKLKIDNEDKQKRISNLDRANLALESNQQNINELRAKLEEGEKLKEIDKLKLKTAKGNFDIALGIKDNTIADLRAEIEKQNTELNKKSDNIENNENTIKKLGQEIIQYKNDKKQLEDNIIRLDKNISDLNQMIKEREMTIHDLTNKIQSLEKNIKGLEDDVNSKEELIKDRDATIHDLKKEIAKKDEEIGLLRRTIEKYIKTPHNESFKINEEIDPL